MRILHVITGLPVGGAELMLLKLLRANAAHCEPCVISLGPEGKIGVEISKLGIPVHSLNLRRFFPNPAAVGSGLSAAQRFRPHLIQGWMPHGNLMAMLAGMWLPIGVSVVWNIRNSLNDLNNERRMTAAAIRLGAALSWYPAKIIYNSHVAAIQHEGIGYRRAKTVIIPNGFDCQMFRSSADARSSVRAELGIRDDALLVGLIARYHPMKDHAGFLRAAGRVAQRYLDVYFLLAGTGVVAQEPQLMRAVTEAKLQDRVFLLGERSDIARLTAALDISCSASAWAEGFSNAIGEAMASGVPCVVTDIGDSTYIVSDTGVSVPPSQPEMLAKAIGDLIDAGPDYRRNLGIAARQRIETQFSLESVAHRYEDLYRESVVNQGS